MTTYFEGLHTEQEIKNKWRELCKRHHPDLGGDPEIMKQVNAQYEARLRDCYRHEYTDEQTEEKINIDKDIAEKAAEIIGLEGLIVELCGRWLWVTGNTYQHRLILKCKQFKFASKKVAWFWHREGDTPRRHKEYSLDDIRAKHGAAILAGSGGYGTRLIGI